MLYTASYQEPAHHHGLLLSICLEIPKTFKVDGEIRFLIPNADLLADYQAKRIEQADYTQQYREQIKHCWGDVKQWLDNLDASQDQTLLCAVPKSVFSHNHLVAKLVKKYRPDCFGGCDVIRVEMPLCKHCNSKMTPGLDASYCASCNVWKAHW